MRKLLISTGALLLAAGAAAAPAYAQYGGSPADQVEGAPANPGLTAPAEDDSDQVMTDESDPSLADEADPAWDSPPDPNDPAGAAFAADAAAGKGEPGADYAGIGDAGQGDVDADQGDVDAYQGDADQDQVDGAEDQGDPGDAVEAGGGDQGATWQGEDGQAYCRRSDGTTGLIVGGGAGALVGRGIDGGRHRGTGTIIGAIAGAIVGSAVERNANQQSCR